ncbi:MAG TPA: LUD domain-containing protein, partial [Pseudacidobacterium sp.]|nr:LUD domain-containing protein [Pseudacidobacterium sp.]
ETSARAAILSRIRATNVRVDAGTCVPEYQGIERSYQQTASMDRAEILQMFTERLHEYDAHVHEATAATLAATIGEALKTNGQKSAVIASDFPRQHLPEGFFWQQESAATTDELNTAEGAICSSEVAIAHTGTIIIKDARELSLLPDRLLCVVYDHQVVETVPEAFARLQQFASEPLTFISGPSATADIEMTRIRGVHGPRFLDVILVKN